MHFLGEIGLLKEKLCWFVFSWRHDTFYLMTGMYKIFFLNIPRKTRGLLAL